MSSDNEDQSSEVSSQADKDVEDPKDKKVEAKTKKTPAKSDGDRTRSSDKKEVCRNYLDGRCNRGKLCKYDHPRENRHDQNDDDFAGSTEDGKIICRDFLRNMCQRGHDCRFHHPQAARPKSWLVLCKDFQNGRCSRNDCRFFHITVDDEELYQQTGTIPRQAVDHVVRKALLLDVGLTGNRPACKDYLKGMCNLPNCRFRHLNPDEYQREVYNALQREFDIVFGPSQRRPMSPSPEMLMDMGYPMGPMHPGDFRGHPGDFRDGMGPPRRGYDDYEFEMGPKRRRHFSNDGPGPMGFDDPFGPPGPPRGGPHWGPGPGPDMDLQDDIRRLQIEIEALNRDKQEMRLTFENQVQDMRQSFEHQILDMKNEIANLNQERASLSADNANLLIYKNESNTHKVAMEKLVTSNDEFLQQIRKLNEGIRKLEKENAELARQLKNQASQGSNEQSQYGGMGGNSQHWQRGGPNVDPYAAKKGNETYDPFSNEGGQYGNSYKQSQQGGYGNNAGYGNMKDEASPLSLLQTPASGNKPVPLMEQQFGGGNSYGGGYESRGGEGGRGGYEGRGGAGGGDGGGRGGGRGGGGGFQRDGGNAGGGFQRDGGNAGGGFQRDGGNAGGGFQREGGSGGAGGYQRDGGSGGGYQRDGGAGGYQRDGGSGGGGGGYQRDGIGSYNQRDGGNYNQAQRGGGGGGGGGRGGRGGFKRGH